MKRLFLIVSLIFVGIALHAQAFMGFRFDLNAEEVKRDNGDKRTSEFGFGAYSDIGKRVSEAWDIGIEFGGTVDFAKNHTSNTETTSAHWLVSPYFRRTVYQNGKFELKARGAFAAEGTKTSNTFSFQVVPVLVYNMSDRFALQTNLNVFRGGISYNKIKDGDGRLRFNAGGNTNNVATLGNITIGFIYKL